MTRSSADDEAAAFLEKHPETKFVDALTFSLTGMAVGKRYPVADLAKLMEKGLQFCSATLLLDVSGVTWDIENMGFTDGDPDWPALPIAGSLAPVPWAAEPTAQFMFELAHPEDPGGWWCDPRAILTRVVAQLAEIGLTPVVACELEFYLINAQRDADGGISTPPVPRTGRVNEAPRVFSFAKLDEFGEFLASVEQACHAQGLPSGAASSEYGRGQYEVNLAHCDDPVKACDQTLLQRRVVQGVAQSFGMDATFMSKPYEDQAGNGFHIHLSLLDDKGENIFDSRREDGMDNIRHVIGGMQATMYDAMAIFAPNLNAYRRFSANNFLPVNKSWGENNRSVAFRIPYSDPSARRVEHRVAGAEANPYLVMATVLASAHLGLARQLDPGPPTEGNAGETVDPDMPMRLWTAIDRMRGSDILSEYLGERYVRAYADLKAAEFDAFMARVLPREYDWYL